MPGPAPKENKHRGDRDTLTPTHVLTAPTTKPPVLRNAEALRKETRYWWQTWTEAPQTKIFTATDWERLQMLALMVDLYYSLMADGAARPTTLVNLLAEIRQNEALMGATHVDRLKGRIKIERPDQGPAGGTDATVTVLDEYRSMLK